VDKILHKGPAYGALEVGDIVISMDGKPICDFVGLESVLDANVGCTVDFVVWRKGTSVPVSVRVQDMYDVSPTQLLSLGHATLHDMSLMLANRYSLEVKGVYIATMSEEFLPAAIFKEHRIIMSVN
ncbi:serine protease, partial [Linderina pennispora]